MANTPQSSTKATEGLEIYQVGGSVRDELMGLPVKDRDYVVVGSTPDDLIERGFTPVGQDFPVFLHPKTHEEYALARTERKQGHGYHGFQVYAGQEVTLEQDLARRDLTINAMALAEDGQLIDPYHGRLDLAQGLLRHVSDAFREDPVRILRLARFATRFSHFRIADSTLALAQEMKASGELDYLVPERVWQEMAQALMYAHPSRFLLTLQELFALEVIWPEWFEALTQPMAARAVEVIDALSDRGDASLSARFAVLCLALDSTDAVEASCQRFRVPKQIRQWAIWAHTELEATALWHEREPAQILRFIRSFDGLRQPQRIDEAEVIGTAWLGEAFMPNRLRAVVDALMALDTQVWVDQGLTGLAFAQALEEAQLASIAGSLAT